MTVFASANEQKIQPIPLRHSTQDQYPISVNGHGSAESFGNRKASRVTRDEIGKRGEDQLVLILQQLIDDRWCILGRNVDAQTTAGSKFGDIDILLLSPNKIGYSIDAKNGVQRVWYDDKHRAVVFDKGWIQGHSYVSKPRRYSNAEHLAAWAERTFEFRKVIPIMAFSDNHDLRIEIKVNDFCMVKVKNIVITLRAIDALFS